MIYPRMASSISFSLGHSVLSPDVCGSLFIPLWRSFLLPLFLRTTLPFDGFLPQPSQDELLLLCFFYYNCVFAGLFPQPSLNDEPLSSGICVSIFFRGAFSIAIRFFLRVLFASFAAALTFSSSALFCGPLPSWRFCFLPLCLFFALLKQIMRIKFRGSTRFGERHQA